MAHEGKSQELSVQRFEEVKICRQRIEGLLHLIPMLAFGYPLLLVILN